MNLLEYQQAAARTSSGDGIVITLAPDQVIPIVGVDAKPDRAMWRIANGATGLGAEACELVGVYLQHYSGVLWTEGTFKDQLKKELGDIMWYLAEAASGLGISLYEIYSGIDALLEPSELRSANLLAVAKEAGETADYLKKLLWHGKKIEWDELYTKFSRVIEAIFIVCREFQLQFSDVLKTNIDKLLIRYKTGFSAAASEARVDLLPQIPSDPLTT